MVFHNSGETLMISVSDVIVYDIVNNADQRVTFLVYVYTKNPTDVLSGKVLQVSAILL